MYFLETSLHSSLLTTSHQLFNISLSTSRKALLINDIEVFPSLTLPPKPNFLAYQIPLNYNVSSLSSTIACANSPCREYDGRCACVEGALGADAISFDFAETKSPEDNAWTVYLDAIGGHNGYLVDPYVEFIAPEQRRLAVYIQSDALGEALEIVGAKLVEREHVPIQIDLSFREKLRKFFGVGCGAHEEPGHVVYRYLEWDDYGKIGTLKHFLLELKGEWPWNLIAIIVGSTIIGLAIIFRIYKFSMEVRGIMIRNNKLARGGFSDEGDKEEGEGLLDSAEQGGNP